MRSFTGSIKGTQIRKPIAPWPENDNPEPSL